MRKPPCSVAERKPCQRLKIRNSKHETRNNDQKPSVFNDINPPAVSRFLSSRIQVYIIVKKWYLGLTSNPVKTIVGSMASHCCVQFVSYYQITKHWGDCNVLLQLENFHLIDRENVNEQTR